ncbi:MAG: hypothetical protein EP340_11385 [Alphaproteobacteria bacterium]|nr:MAG: hypothetical protein EP340_11385 [Alphaproteobacteria bacterium]
MAILNYFSAYPIVLAVLIVLATFILEDGATIGACLLALDGYMDPQLALGSLIFGIAIGDLGLYGIGAYASDHPKALKYIGEKRITRGRKYLNERLTMALITARCLPGTRMPTYVASGFLRVNFLHFAMVAIIAASLWASFFFWAIFSFGQIIVEKIGSQIWMVGLVLLIFMIFLPKAWTKRMKADNDGKED